MIKRIKRLFYMLILLAVFLLGMFIAGGEGALLQQTDTLPETLENALNIQAFQSYIDKLRELWNTEAVTDTLCRLLAWLQRAGK